MTDQKHTKDHWETISNGIKPIDQIWISQVKNLQITLSLLTKQRDELREALKALVNLLDKKKPRKLDEAITWVENENMVMKMVNLALTKTKGAV